MVLGVRSPDLFDHSCNLSNVELRPPRKRGSLTWDRKLGAADEENQSRRLPVVVGEV